MIALDGNAIAGPRLQAHVVGLASAMAMREDHGWLTRTTREGVLMARTLSNPAGLHPAPGFSHVAVSRGSTMVHFAGQIALDENFGIIGGADLFEQTQAAMRNLETAMNEAGVAWQDIVRRTIYTTQPTQYEVITSAIHSVTGGADDPPQTIVGITGLAIDGLLIEIERTAMLD
jgi:enamine deaminase RidA (YjgF/YER057c/UK114 family)